MSKLKIPSMLYRDVEFERDSIDEEKRTIDLSISSDAPYKRYFGNEILDHSPKSIDMSRLKDGAPLLFNHDRDFVLGRILSAKSDGTCLRIKAQIAENSKAQDMWPDIKNGIISKASVGYSVKKMVLEEEKDDDCTYRVTEWCPYEGSLVTIPADASVGVGRAAEVGEVEIEVGGEKVIDAQTPAQQRAISQTQFMETTVTEKPTIDVVAERSKAVAEDRKRANDISDLSRHFAEKGLGGRKIDTAELAEQFKREGKSVQDFQDAVVRGNFNEAKPVQITAPELGLSKKEVRRFSLARAILMMGKNKPLDGVEREASDAHAKIVGKEADANSFYIPQDVWNGRGMHEFNAERHEQLRALFAGTYSAAGALVGTTLMSDSLIELLRNQMFVVQMGARSMSGLVDNIAIPRQTGGATASWLAEDATGTATNQTVGQLNLTPHRLFASTAYTEQLLGQTGSPDIENFVRQDLMAIIAIERDRAAINGSGVSGEPQGIIGLENGSTLSTKVTLAATQSMSYLNAVTFETNVAVANALVGKLGYLTTPTVRGRAKLIAEISAANSTPVWKNNEVNGYPAMATNQMPTTTGSTIFGNWDDLILAEWAKSSLFVDPYSLSMAGQIRVINRMYCDNGVRHGKSFAISVDS